MRLLEVTIASLMLLGFIVVADMGLNQKDESPRLVQNVYNAYEFLDKSGQLREFAVAEPKNLTGFAESLRDLLPSAYEYTVGCKNMTHNSIQGSIPQNESVYVFGYVVSGYGYKYDPTAFIIYMW